MQLPFTIRHCIHLALGLALVACQTAPFRSVSADRVDEMYRWAKDLELLHSPRPDELVRGANAEHHLRFDLDPVEALVFVEGALLSKDSKHREIANALVQIYARRVNEHLYLQISPLNKSLDAAALEVDSGNPEQLLVLMAEFMKRKGLTGPLSNYYQMNDSDAGAGVAFRMSAAGRVETVSYDRYLAMPWVDERDISSDFEQVRKPKRSKISQ